MATHFPYFKGAGYLFFSPYFVFLHGLENMSTKYGVSPWRNIFWPMADGDRIYVRKIQQSTITCSSRVSLLESKATGLTFLLFIVISDLLSIIAIVDTRQYCDVDGSLENRLMKINFNHHHVKLPRYRTAVSLSWTTGIIFHIISSSVVS